MSWTAALLVSWVITAPPTPRLPPSGSGAASADPDRPTAPAGAPLAPPAREDDEAPTRDVSPQDVRGADARMRVLVDRVGYDLKRIPGDHRLQRFAVMRLEERGAQAKERELGLVLSDMVVTDLARRHHLPLVERAALARILDEQALGQSGAVDESQAALVGRVAGARGLVIGSVTDAPEGFRVILRAVDVETAEVLSSHEALLPGEELLSYAAGSVVLRSRSGALFRSLVAPGWGQLYNDQPVKAAAFGGVTGVLAITTAAALGLGVYKSYVEYPNLGPDDEKDAAALAARLKSTRETGNTAIALGGVLAGATAVSWLITAMDAWLSGHDVESADAALATR